MSEKVRRSRLERVGKGARGHHHPRGAESGCAMWEVAMGVAAGAACGPLSIRPTFSDTSPYFRDLNDFLVNVARIFVPFRARAVSPAGLAKKKG